MTETTVVIVSAVRTPIGSFLGSFSQTPAHVLGAHVIKEALHKCQNVLPENVSEVLMGQVLSATGGQNPARQAAMAAHLPNSVPALGISMVCGSGLKSVALASMAIQTGNSRIVIAGGMEVMSKAPHATLIRSGIKFGDFEMVDTMLKDGLTDAFSQIHMGITAENVAKLYSLTREEQDEFAFRSQEKAKRANETGAFLSEIVPIVLKGGKIVSVDEHPRPQTTLESLSRLRPVFDSNGSVTAGNSSGLNDGAAAVVLMSQKEAIERNCSILASIVSHVVVGVPPEIMGIGPIEAITKAVEKAGWKMNDVDIFEINEAFAAQSLACIKALNLDESKVNPCGGGIALGHPIGASGCRILVTLIHSLIRNNKRKGVAAACIGGGMGIALCIERAQ